MYSSNVYNLFKSGKILFRRISMQLCSFLIMNTVIERRFNLVTSVYWKTRIFDGHHQMSLHCIFSATRLVFCILYVYAVDIQEMCTLSVVDTRCNCKYLSSLFYSGRPPNTISDHFTSHRLVEFAVAPQCKLRQVGRSSRHTRRLELYNRI